LTFLSAFQIIFDIVAAFGIGILLLKLARAPKDDPRLSRGLQILQSKIAILEDLSDRTENQVRGLMALLDQKNIEVQTRIDKAGEQIRNVESSIQSSMDVAKIFQDKIPHQEIIERKNTLKYLQAARLANQGQTSQQIAQVIDLPLGEIEFIAKVNRDQLTFSIEDLPAWAKAELAQQDEARNYRHEPGAQSTQTQMQTDSGHVPRHAFSSDLNFLGHSIGEIQTGHENQFEVSEEISPLASFANEPPFQAFQSFKYQAENQQVIPEPVERVLSAQDARQLTTLRRTQSLIANLDRQFTLSSVDVDEELPPPPMKKFEAPLIQRSVPIQSAVKNLVPFQESNIRQVSNRSQGSAPFEAGSIRRVVFPTISANKANARRLDR
jgi:hypothetical protein